MHGSSDVFFISDKKIVKYDTETSDCTHIDVELDDRILGSGSYGTNVLVFTLCNGLHCVKIDGKQNGSTIFAEEMSIVHNLEKLQNSNVDGENTLNQFKRAFLLYLKQKIPESEKMLQGIIQRTANSKYQLADLVVQFAHDILDDYPSTDTRWSKIIDQSSSGIRLSTTPSLLISHQLENKKQTFELYVEFLKRMGLFKMVHLIKNPIDPLRKIHVQLILNECREKLCACLAVFEKDHTEVQPYLKSAIVNILKERNESILPELTYQDQFFRKVSSCESLITGLINELKSQLVTQNEECLPIDKICIISQYILDFLSGASKCRLKYAPSVYQSLEISLLMDEQGAEEYFPTSVPSYWTSPDQSALIRSLHDLWSLLVEYLKEWYKSSSEDFKRSSVLAKLLSDLVSHLLNDLQLPLLYWTNKRKNENLSHEKIDEYKNLRRKLIDPLLITSQYDHAANLAENFQDFDILIELCKLNNDDLLLERYRTKFADQNFDKAYDHWLLKQKKYDQLLDRRPEDLTAFLDATNRSDLLWISHLVNNDFLKASQCLYEISSDEKESISKKKTLLSIAKLAALSVDENLESHIDTLNKELDLITFQEQAPSSALQSYFHGEEMLKPMTALEIVDMYTLDPEATEVSFLKAVELLANCYAQREISEEEFIDRKIKLWARSVLRDDWTTIINSDEPLKFSKSTLFSRTMDFLVDLFSKGSIPLDFIHTILPDADRLIECQELENYGENSVFQYILKAGQEIITQSLKSN
uniref:Nucleoporin Nup133/Nup155-like C-terminal domain-containing protein n=1 Tax=Romanomermis culicivorax TaxID=13658 RepID=A0A915J2J2_ROMCU